MADVWTLILAAGASSRFGGIKALASWHSETLLARAIATATAVSSGDKIMVVTGAHHVALLPHLNRTRHVFNADWASGLGSSIACGVAGILAEVSPAIVVILPVDQPLVEAGHLQALVTAARQTGKAAFTQQDGVTGPPVALPAVHIDKAIGLRGTTGLKQAIPASQTVTVASATALTDIDTQEDLARLLKTKPVVIPGNPHIL